VEQYEEFMQLMLSEASEYVRGTMQLMQMTQEQFDHLFKTVGHVYGIYENQQLAGFYWVEEREKVLHLHALILKSKFQSRGIGTQVMNMLALSNSSIMNCIELGVHESNHRAIRMY